VWQFIWKPYHWEKTEHGIVSRKHAVPAPRVTAQPVRRRRYR